MEQLGKKRRKKEVTSPFVTFPINNRDTCQNLTQFFLFFFFPHKNKSTDCRAVQKRLESWIHPCSPGPLLCNCQTENVSFCCHHRVPGPAQNMVKWKGKFWKGGPFPVKCSPPGVWAHPRRGLLGAPIAAGSALCSQPLDTHVFFHIFASPFSPVSLPVAILKRSPNDKLRDRFFLAYARSLPIPPTKSIDHHWDGVTPGAVRQQRDANCKRQIKSPLTVLSTSTKRAFLPYIRLCKTLLDWKEKQHMATRTFGQRKSQGGSCCICNSRRRCRMMLWEHQWCQELCGYLSLLQHRQQRWARFFGSNQADTRHQPSKLETQGHCKH